MGQKVEEDGSCSDRAALEALDWALEGLVGELPQGQVASVLLERVGPHPDDASELLITLAERIALRQYKSLGEDDRPILVAQLLQLAETKGWILPLKPSAPTGADVARVLSFCGARTGSWGIQESVARGAPVVFLGHAQNVPAGRAVRGGMAPQLEEGGGSNRR